MINPPRRPSPKLWDERLRRAEALEALRPESAEILRFFRRLTESQRYMARQIADRPTRNLHKLDYLPLLFRVENEGPKALSVLAAAMRQLSTADREALLEKAWAGAAGKDADPGRAFLVRTMVAPLAVHWATNDPAPRKRGEPGRCPYCGDQPAAALLREDKEAEALRRSLVCALCATEWDFVRVGCPGCGETEPSKLPRFAAMQLPGMRIEGCESCKRYVKAADLSKEPAAEPIADDLASPALDLVARDRGYAKLVPNAAGL